MAVNCGVRLAHGCSPDPRLVETLAARTEWLASEGSLQAVSGEVAMIYQPATTTARSKDDTQPRISSAGPMLVFDGRLDNYRELSDELGLSAETCDSAVVLAALATWDLDAFSKFVGDWAIAAWFPQELRLVLARDHAGTRSLYFRTRPGELMWSSRIESLIEETLSPTTIDDNYIARFLSCQPVGDYTPYRSILSVPPGKYMVVGEHSTFTRTHWEPIVGQTIRYKCDREYEDHCLALMKVSVRRRIQASKPVVAQLSGGMDSSAIVCIADLIRREAGAETGLVDTISYFDKTEPTWDDHKYFETVETHRNKVGIHIDVSRLPDRLEPLRHNGPPISLPGATSSSLEFERLVESALSMGGHHVVLSGIGGDELLGGVANPLPELADHLTTGHLWRFAVRSVEWCLPGRDPVARMMLGTIAYVASIQDCARIPDQQLPPWLSPRIFQLARLRNHEITHGRGPFWCEPSKRAKGLVWWNLLDSLPHTSPSVFGHYEYRYPYLDREFVDFLLRLPADQLVRPGRRRSLMRRALHGIVPQEVIERRRKAYVSRSPTLLMRASHDFIERIFRDSLLSAYGFVDSRILRESYSTDLRGQPRWTLQLLRAIWLEIWLRYVTKSGDVASSGTKHSVQSRS